MSTLPRITPVTTVLPWLEGGAYPDANFDFHREVLRANRLGYGHNHQVQLEIPQPVVTEVRRREATSSLTRVCLHLPR